MFELDFLRIALGLHGPLYLGGGTPGPTAQQVAEQTMENTQNANLNLEENEQRKVILNAMQGTRVFRGSALSRQIAGNSAGTVAATPPSAPSSSQQNAPLRTPGSGTSLLDTPGASPTGGLAVQGQPSSAGRGAVGPGRGAAGGGRA